MTWCPRRGGFTVALYTLFAALAILANLGAQHATLTLIHVRGALVVAMVVGTFVGLALKYVLDKKWIFHHKSRSAVHDFRTFVGYCANGIATTMIFWGTELIASAISSHAIVRDVGATVGLIIGYYIKYRLDKRFVFKN